MRLFAALSLAFLLLITAGSDAHAKRYHGKSVRHHDGRPRAWCGWYMGIETGRRDRRLWLAANWAKEGRASAGPCIRCIVVWAHHVGMITGRAGNQWVVKSGNDGGRVRERPRSIAGAIAFRIL